jgi:hypothetical protein
MSGSYLVAKKLTILVTLALVVVAGMAIWQVASVEIANAELRDELHDVASKLGTRIGFSAPKSDDDYRAEIVRRAGKLGIALTPEQVTVERKGSGENETITLTAEYTVSIRVPGFAYPMHFSPSSARG